MATLPSCWLRYSRPRPSDVTLWYLYLTVVIPITRISYHVVARPPADILGFTASLLGAFTFMCLLSRVPRAPIQSLSRSRMPFFTWWTVTFGLALVLVVAVSGQQTLDWSVDDIYARRLTARTTIDEGSPLGYAAVSLTKALAPVLIAMALTYKRPLLAIPAVAGLVVMFGISGEKADALFPLFCISMFAILKGTPRTFAQVVLVTCVGLMLLQIYLYRERDSVTLMSLFGQRLFLTHAVTATYYWDFFSNNPLVLFSDSWLSPFIEPRYPVNVVFLIGDVYYDSPEQSANVDMWSSAYAQLGHAGIWSVSAVAASVLWVLDSLALVRHPIVCGVVGGLFGIAWSEGALHSSLLSNGVLLSLIVIFSLPSERPSNESLESSAQQRYART